MMELTKLKRATKPDDDPLSGATGGEEDEEQAGGIANMRVVNASKVVRQRQIDYFSAHKDAAICITTRIRAPAKTADFPVLLPPQLLRRES